MTSPCGRARRLMFPAEGPRLESDESRWARDHMEHCPACRQFMEDMARLRATVRDGAGDSPAPSAVRSRVFEAVSQARLDRRVYRRRWTGIVVAAAAVAMVAIALWRPHPRIETVAPITALVDDHVRAGSAAEIRSADQREIERWLSARLAFAVRVPPLEQGSLRGARICVIEGRAGAAVEYEIEGVLVSYYVLMLPGPQGPDQPAGPPRLATGTSAGYRLVSWADGGLKHTLVGALPGRRLEQLAHLCMEQVMAAGPRHRGPPVTVPDRADFVTAG
ncbi:MAG: hypothetical protein AB7I33_16220 [Gemmatimonadales bacterium]